MREQSGARAITVDTFFGDALPSDADRYQAGMLLSMTADGAAAIEHLEAFTKRHADDPRASKAKERLAELYMREQRYADSARVMRELSEASELRDTERRSLAQSISVARSLEHAPRMTRISTEPNGSDRVSGRLPTHIDKGGLTRVGLIANGVDVEAVWDTGANFSVMQASTARALGATMLPGQVEVHSLTGEGVPGTMAIVARLEIGEVSLRDVPFLVLEDELLSFPDFDYTIPFILGFGPILELGRYSTEPGLIRIGDDADPIYIDSANTPTLAIVSNDLVVAATVAGVAVPMIYDSGASHSQLAGKVFDRIPSLRDDATQASTVVRGAGGKREHTVYVVPTVRISAGGKTTMIEQIHVDTQGELESSYGRLGQDFTGNDSVTIDFSTGQFRVTMR